MTFETETYLTLGEYKKLSRKLIFKRRPVWLLLVAATISTAMLILNWAGIITELEPIYQSLFYLFVMLGLSVVFLAFGNNAEKYYNSNKMLSHKMLYVFDEEKIFCKLPGAEGSMVWEYISRCEHIDNFLVLYRSDRFAYIIKVDGFNAAQIAFIKSKIKMPERFSNVKAIR